MSTLPVTERTTLRRAPQRGSFERDTVNAILDEGLVCHVGFALDGQPWVIPTIHARIDQSLYLHGSSASRMLRALAAGTPACVTVTLVDGLVLARSAFHHSMNYRSAVLFGSAVEVSDAGEKLRALEALVEHVVPGRWKDVRGPSMKEFARTLVLRLPIDEASAKIRSGPPIDDDEDHELAIWAGLLPLRLEPQAPVDDGRLLPGVELPSYVSSWGR